ncbi:MAG: DNA primase [Phycisphaerales bacterium]
MQLNDDRQRVLDATDLVRLIGEHVTLRAKGREYLGLCPFHDDHKPSMYVVPAKQIYHCFSCGAGGNAFTFVMNYHKMGFREAIEYLADKGGVKLTPWSPSRSGVPAGEYAAEDASVSTRSVLLRANLTARDFFRTVLGHAEHGRPARELVARRAIAPAMVEAFELGAAPDRWDGLLQTAQKKGLDLQPLLDLGLLKRRETGPGSYDAFRDRLIFPIHDQIGRVIGFGGRRLRDKNADGSDVQDAKYLNSSESIVFNKSTTLYGMHQAAQDIRRSRVAIITEGYMDTIACHQAGVRNAVAALGTALTPQNAKMLRRLCETVVLLFDADAAGQKATDRALEALFAEPIDVKIALMSSVHGAKDPDELLKQPGGLDRFRQMIDGAEDALEYRFSRLRARIAGQGLAAQTRAIQDELARLVELGLPNVEPIRQRLIIKRIATLLRIDEETVVRSIPSVRRGASDRARAGGGGVAGPVGGADAATADVPRTPAEQIIACILCDGALAHSLEPTDRELASSSAMSSQAGREIAAAIWELASRGVAPGLAPVLLELHDASAVRAATAWQQDTERLTQGSAQLLHRHWRDRLEAARRESRERRLAEMLSADAPAPGPESAPDEDAWSHTLEQQAPPDAASALHALLKLREHASEVAWNPTRVPKGLSG